MIVEYEQFLFSLNFMIFSTYFFHDGNLKVEKYTLSFKFVFGAQQLLESIDSSKKSNTTCNTNSALCVSATVLYNYLFSHIFEINVFWINTTCYKLILKMSRLNKKYNIRLSIF